MFSVLSVVKQGHHSARGVKPSSSCYRARADRQHSPRFHCSLRLGDCGPGCLPPIWCWPSCRRLEPDWYRAAGTGFPCPSPARVGDVCRDYSEQTRGETSEKAPEERSVSFRSLAASHKEAAVTAERKRRGLTGLSIELE